MPSKNKFYAIIPSRYASTRFPAKALALIGDKPLFYHVYQRALQSNCFTEVYLAIDDERLEEKAKELQVPYILTSTSHSTGTDRVREAAKKLELSSDSIVVNVQGDEPFLTKNMFEAIIKPFKEQSNVECSTLGVILDPTLDKERILSPNQVKIVLTKSNKALYFSRSPIPYIRDNLAKAPYIGHLGIYAFRFDILEIMASFKPSPLEETEKLEQLRLLENNISISVSIVESGTHGVDTAEDLQLAQEFYAQNPQFWL